jgi:broad specificity phosphatase PhoE
MLSLVLVRHGHVEGISPPSFRGRTDLPLTPTGTRQAAMTRDRLAGRITPAAVYASPLSRCMSTARIIGEPHARAPVVLPGFNDIDYGEWQGRSYEEVARSDPAGFAAWRRTPHLAEIPGGESLFGVARRVADTVRMLLARHQGETVVLVGHDSVNRVLLLLALDLSLSHYWRLRQSPAAINELSHSEKDGWVVTSINETAHLGAGSDA